MAAPLAVPDDVAAIWRPLTTAETAQVTTLIAVASAKLRQAAPFNVDDRVALFGTDPTQPTALDPVLVANVVATIVKRYLVNPQGLASETETTGPMSHSATYVNRNDKTGADVRGGIHVTDSDIEQLRPAVPAQTASSFRVGIPHPALLVPNAVRPRHVQDALNGGVGSVIEPDYAPGTGTE